MTEDISEDYIRGYSDGMFNTNGMINTKLHMVRMFVEDLITQQTKPEALEEIKNYTKEGK